MSREAEELVGEIDEEADGGMVGVECELSELIVVEGTAMPPVDFFSDLIDEVEAKTEGFTDIADGGPWSVGDDFGGDAGVVAAVLLVDVLDDFFAAFVFEIDVDVGGFVSGGGEEAFEEEIDPCGVDGGDTDAVADGGIGGGASTLAEDAAIAGELDEVVDGEEVGFVLEFLDEGKFVMDELADLVRDALGVAVGGAVPGEVGEVLDGGFVWGHELMGIFIFELVEGEGALLGDFDGLADGVGVVGEESMHLCGRFEISFGVGEEAITGLVDGARVADAGEDILEHAAMGGVIVDVIGCEEGDAVVLAEVSEFGEAAVIVEVVEAADGEGESMAEGIAEVLDLGQLILEGVGGWSGDSGEETCVVLEEVGQMEGGFTVFVALSAECEESAEASVGVAVSDPDEEIGRVGEGEA